MYVCSEVKSGDMSKRSEVYNVVCNSKERTGWDGMGVREMLAGGRG